MKNLAPSIFRKRLLAEGFFSAYIDEKSITDFFRFITNSLNLKTYGEPVIHETKGVGIDENQGYDAFVPLIDSGIYLGIWAHQKFLSLIIYTCKDFDEHRAITKIKEFFGSDEVEFKTF
jgi:S-adenosylmethionine/arginine decarboxylase-like enzyme